MTNRKKISIGLGSVLAAAVIIYIGGLIWLLASDSVLQHPLAKYPLWPVGCTSRGCVTSASWVNQHNLHLHFAATASIEAPTPEQTLTTLMRRHIINHAFLRSPVTPADAQKYREAVLNIRTQEQLKKLVDVSLADYDRQVIIPFLQQEALRQQNKAESAADLYKQLGQERLVIMLPFHLRWDKDSGQVIRR